MKTRIPRRPRGRPRSEPITPAELRVLELLRLGRTNNEIAEQLGISTETVKTHVSSMLLKLDLESRKQLAEWVPTEERRHRGFLAVGTDRLLGVFRTPRLWVAQHSVAVTTMAVLLVLACGLVLAAWTRPGGEEPDGTPVAALAATTTISPPALRLSATPTPRPATPSPTAAAASPLRPAWTRYFGGNDHEEANAVAVGPDGSVYVTGYTLSRTFSPGKRPDPDQGKLADIFIVKYDAFGRYQWGHVHGADRKDVGNAVAVAPDGSVYVAGSVQNEDVDGQENSGGSDALLMKYSPDGQRVWTRLWGAAENDAAYALAAAADGTVYVTGHIGSLDGTTPFLAAFDADGRQIVNVRVPAATSLEAISVDEDAVLAAGTADDESVLIRFGRDGVLHWRREFGRNQSDRAAGIAVASGAVFVGGRSAESRDTADRTTLDTDIFLARFSNAGTTHWIRYFDRDDDEEATAGRHGGLVAAGGSRIYVLGVRGDVRSARGTIIAYSLDGRYLGAVDLGPSYPGGVAAAPDGSIYVTNVYTFDSPQPGKLTLMKFLPRWRVSRLLECAATPPLRSPADAPRHDCALRALRIHPLGRHRRSHLRCPETTQRLGSQLLCPASGPRRDDWGGRLGAVLGGHRRDFQGHV